ncbi:MAG: glycosyltransferase family 4 protein, partial [Chitinophagales bacterium]|nr:glycosyltransferase family 4 protein [Chitinophagales bacterium]
ITQPKKATITFTSWLKDVDEVYAGSDVVALTSLNEGTPVSIIEALAANKPIVSTRVGGVSDLIEEGKNGLIVSSNDLVAFTNALNLLIENIELRNAMGNGTNSDAQLKYSYQRLMLDMNSLYNRLLQ